MKIPKSIREIKPSSRQPDTPEEYDISRERDECLMMMIHGNWWQRREYKAKLRELEESSVYQELFPDDANQNP